MEHNVSLALAKPIENNLNNWVMHPVARVSMPKRDFHEDAAG
jgi:hypothetical protein